MYVVATVCSRLIIALILRIRAHLCTHVWCTMSYRQSAWSKKTNRLSVQIIKVLHHLTGLKMLCVKALLFERLLTPCPKLSTSMTLYIYYNVCGSYGVFKVHDCPHSVIKSTNLYTHVWCTVSYRQSDQRKKIVYKSS